MTADGNTVLPGRSVNPWLLAPIVAMAAFMEVLDISIANVALQHIAGSLSASQEESTWILTAYLVSNAIVLPISGWLSTVMGRKRFFMACIAGFSLSSLLCGIAPTLGLLILFRTLQGATGGGLQPVSQAVLTDAFPPHQRGMAFAFYGMAVVFAPAIGPTLGGWITDNASWHWVFLINVPVGVILLLLTEALVHDSEDQEAERQRRLANGFRVDYVGLGLLAIGLGFLQVVLDKGQQNDWFDSGMILWMTVTCTVALVAFVFWELRRDNPVVEVSLFRDRNFLFGNILMFMLGFILLGSTVLIPLYVQSLLGYTAMDAGLVLSPGGFVIMLAMPVVGRLVSRFDARWIIMAGLLLGAGALFHMSSFSAATDYESIMLARIVQAIGLGFLFIPITTVAYANLSRFQSDAGSAIVNLSRNLGGSVGISLAVTVLARRSQVHQHALVSNVSAYSDSYQRTAQGLSHALSSASASASGALQQAQSVIYGLVQGQARMLAFVDDFRIMGAIFVAMIPLAFLLRRSAAGDAPPAH
ncbi:MAG TPA: DHA2 family efflux MFS transporter permease subunit [Gammaproteobacteria bacterium]|nr:DHA2 family efflux MFS transporter permease subunit [Gammaproteobacteria bacterium]